MKRQLALEKKDFPFLKSILNIQIYFAMTHSNQQKKQFPLNRIS